MLFLHSNWGFNDVDKKDELIDNNLSKAAIEMIHSNKYRFNYEIMKL